MPKRIAPLSENKISGAKSMEKAYKLYDGNGLFLIVTPRGSKYWRFKYRFGGKEKSLSIGTYPKVSLNDARSNRDSARELLVQGIDPSVLRKEEKEREASENLETERMPSVRFTIDEKIEIWKGTKVLRLSRDEAKFITNILTNIME